MIRFDWNGLAPGDVVFVHHPPTPPHAAVRGVVERVTVRPGQGNDVGIRLDEGDHPIIWPSGLAVHRDAGGSREQCWRCHMAAAADGHGAADRP